MWTQYTSYAFVFTAGLIQVGFVSTLEDESSNSTFKTLQEQVSVRLLYGEGNGISWTDLNINDRLPPLISEMYMGVLSVDYHYNRRCLFYSSRGNVQSFPLEDGGCSGVPRTLAEGVGATSVAVDWVRDRIYWTSMGHRTLQRVDLTGTNLTLIMRNTGNISIHQNVVLDPYSRFLFLATEGDNVIRTNLDGEDLVNIGIEYNRNLPVVSLALDTHRKRLYISTRWDYLPHIISCEYDGSRVQDYQLTGKWWNRFVSIGVFGNQLFWAHFGWEELDTVWKANVSAGGTLTWMKEYTIQGTILDPNVRIWSLKVYHPDVQQDISITPSNDYYASINGSLHHEASTFIITTIIFLTLLHMLNLNYNRIIDCQ